MRALALAALLLLPLVAGDHLYSHRYVLDGRLVGSDGAPLPGRVVELLAEDVGFFEPCPEQQQRSVTDESGDFRFCFHAHALGSGGRVGARAGNASALAPVDASLRRAYVALQDPHETGVAPEGWASTYRVGGRVWRAGATTIENVSVLGAALQGAPVNLTVHTPDGGETRFGTTTSQDGDFDLVVETEAAPGDVLLTIESMGLGQPASLDGVFHRTTASIVLGPEGADGQSAPATPGTAKPRASPLLLAGIAAALALTIGLARRRRE